MTTLPVLDCNRCGECCRQGGACVLRAANWSGQDLPVPFAGRCELLNERSECTVMLEAARRGIWADFARQTGVSGRCDFPHLRRGVNVGLRLIKTCDACPEQYEAFRGPELVGYLRLRHGSFCVECPDVGGEVVYEADTEGDGRFTDAERPGHLNAALGAVEAWLAARASIASSDPGREGLPA